MREPATIRRRFVSIGQRTVHLRETGAVGAPVVVALHQSPRNSAELAPLMALLAPEFHVIAPDTPGFGLSTPLPSGESGIDAFALALKALLDRLGVAQPILYGVHTGASIATRFAARWPQRAAHLIANGTVALTDAERAEFLQRYLPRFEPSDDGAHLVWAWQRIRDQAVFFPWYDRRVETRMARGFHAAGLVHAQVMDLFAAGDAYRIGYAAALSYNAAQDLATMAAPTTLIAMAGDPLTEHLPRLGQVAASVAVVRTTPGAETDAAIQQACRGAVGVSTAPALAPADTGALFAGNGLSGFRSGGAEAPPVLLLADLTSSWRALTPFIQGLSARFGAVLALDPPGQGESLSVDGGLEVWAGALSAAAAELLRTPPIVVGVGWSGALALDVARRVEARAVHLLAPPLSATARWFPDLTPTDEGAHLLRAWRFVRDRRLFAPWFAPTAENAIPGPVDLDAAGLHREAVLALQGGPAAATLAPELTAYDWAGAAQRVGAPVTFMSFGWGPDRDRAEAAAAASGARFALLPQGQKDWAQALLAP